VLFITSVVSKINGVDSMSVRDFPNPQIELIKNKKALAV
jgi:hypothetical protein